MEISLGKLNEIFKNAFQEEVNLTMSSSKETLSNWDSINHLNLIVELESELNINFAPEEIETITSVVKIIEVIKSK
jgi:acyl carrier protein